MRSSIEGGKGATRTVAGVESDEVVAIDGGCIGVTGVAGLGVVVLLSGVGVARLDVLSGVGVGADVSGLEVSKEEVNDEVEISDSSSNDSLSPRRIGIGMDSGRSSITSGPGSQSISEGSYI